MNLAMAFPEKEQPFWQSVFHREGLTEVRLRAEKPALAYVRREEFFLGKDGEFQKSGMGARVFSARELSEIMLHLCKYSPYAYEEELREGYLTLEGGHRLGIAGTVSMSQGRIQCVKYVTFLNLRIACQVKGAADVILPHVYQNGVPQNLLIVSPPGYGKTTMLRELIRKVSDGNAYGAGRTVGVVDERMEISGSFAGVPQKELGIRTDVLGGCPKALGMRLIIRSMAPEILAVDELGKPEDLEELREAMRCGVKIFATLHGKGMEDVMERGLAGLFDLIAFLGRGSRAPTIMFWKKGDESRGGANEMDRMWNDTRGKPWNGPEVRAAIETGTLDG